MFAYQACLSTARYIFNLDHMLCIQSHLLNIIHCPSFRINAGIKSAYNSQIYIVVLCYILYAVVLCNSIIYNLNAFCI